ncbi:MAG TPA: DUF5961 family protein [Caulobacteraceae bacterium]
MTPSPQSYLVHLRHGAGRRAVAGESFEDAALAYLEACHPPADAEGEVSLVVREEASGCEQCFRIDVASGRAEPC